MSVPLKKLVGERVTVRPVTTRSRARIIRCLKGSADYRKNFTEHRTTAAWADALLDEAEVDDDRRVAIVEAKGEIVGVVELVRDNPEQVTIALLVVQQSARMAGLGREIVSLLAEHFAKEGIDELALGVVAKNLGALAFWEALGFERTGQLGTPRERLVTMSRRRG